MSGGGLPADGNSAARSAAVKRQGHRGQAVRRGAGRAGDPNPGIRGDRPDRSPGVGAAAHSAAAGVDRTLAGGQIDVAATTHAEYARILRGRVAAQLGDLQIAEISRFEHLDPWKAVLSRELMPAGVRKH